MASRHWLYFGGFVVAGILTVGAGLMGIVDGLSALSGGVSGSEELILLTALAEAAEWVAIALVFGLFSIVFLAATVVSILRNGALPRDDRLVAIVERLEYRYPILRRLEVSETFEPTAEDRRRELKERYVEGEISEAEFERKLSELMDDDSERSSPSRGTTVEIEDRSR